MIGRFILVAIGIVFFCGNTISVADEPTFEQKAQVLRIARDLDQASQHLDRGDSAQAGSYWLRAHQRGIDFLKSADGQQSKLLAGEISRLVELRAMISKRRIALPDVAGLSAAPEITESSEPMASADSDSPSFEVDVAPILVEKCGRCHIDGKRGRFNMATVALLVQRPMLIIPGSPAESQLFTIIETGEMPKGPGRISPAEIQRIRDWIQAGAKFSDIDRDKNLNQIVRGEAVPEASSKPTEASQSPTAGEVVSFAQHVAPILVEHCAVCHMDGQRVSGGLNLSTFESIQRGGDNGMIVRAGQGEVSALVKKLRGTGGGQQMPAGSAPLPDELIQTIASWIDQGARFDGGNANASLRDIIARAASANATHEELATQRTARATANWELIMDGKSPEVFVSSSLVVLSPDEESKPEQFAAVAEAVISRVVSQLKVSAKEPLVKGKLSAYVFSTRYDYGEFGKMIEKRDLPKEWTNHWGNNQVDAYIVFHASPSEYAKIRPLIARNAAAAYAKGLASDVPDWFANGWGYWIAAKIYGGEDVVKQWTQTATDLTQRMAKPDDFIQRRMTDDDSGLVAFQFIEYLKKEGGNRFNKMISEMRGGASFERSFVLAFDRTPAEMLSQQ